MNNCFGLIVTLLLCACGSSPTTGNSSNLSSSSSDSTGSSSASSSKVPNPLNHTSLALGNWSLYYNYFALNGLTVVHMLNDSTAQAASMNVSYSKGLLSNIGLDTLSKTVICNLDSSIVYGSIMDDQTLQQAWDQRTVTKCGSSAKIGLNDVYLLRNGKGTIAILNVIAYSSDSDEVNLDGRYYNYTDTVLKTGRAL